MKDSYIRLRLSASEKELIRSLAMDDKITMTEFICKLVHKEKSRREVNGRYGTNSN